jgi:chondroitin 4-sulfotransferase 11
VPISHAHRAIFVHIPKTAGTSIEAVLGMHGDKRDIGIVPYYNQTVDCERLYGRQMQHLTAQGIRNTLNDDRVFGSYFKFTVVRNPWDRLVSTLAWSDQKWARGEELAVADFDRTLRQIYAAICGRRGRETPLSLPPHLHPQCSYLRDAQEGLLVDFVARYENLQADWEVIGSKLGVSATLPVRMKSHHRHYREYYSSDTRGMVAEMYAPDVTTLRYEF